jgi:hypothetical protein
MNKIWGAYLVVGMVILFAVQLNVAGAAKTGKFDAADFFAPDYNNGAAESIYPGESRTFNYNCHCADQPGTSSCSGYITLHVDTGGGFINEKSDACNIGEMQSCYANYVKTFTAPGVYMFRIFCDESAGTDFTQPSSEYVAITVLGTCTDGQTKLCTLQKGVCQGAYETCAGGVWPGCDYNSIPGYEAKEATCDGLDNDCNGAIDDAGVGNGPNPCIGVRSSINELLITGLNVGGNISIYSYNSTSGQYVLNWAYNTGHGDPGVLGSLAGGEIGDLTHDGQNDFIITTYTKRNNYYLEVWTYNPSSGQWYNVWTSPASSSNRYIGEIGDFDNDGFTEFVASYTNGNLEVWGNDTYNAAGFSLQHTVAAPCSGYFKAGGDLNNNGIPEIVGQCGALGPLRVYEWNEGTSSFDMKASLTSPMSLLDDIECGDVDRDGVDECVFCGNSGKSHVLDYSGGTYSVVYNTTQTPGSGNYTQTCSVGDVTNDGWPDWFDVSGAGLRVFSYNGNEYVNIWNSSYSPGAAPPIGASYAGDSDNDGKTEFISGENTGIASPAIRMYESDSINATSFENTFSWSSITKSQHIMIGDLKP